ncbi:MAG: RsmE family RNA methyltransferase [Candidatus Omnitrophota bacterium]|nr:16S rRNA (uracil(1498)-N(3))-methyltransferase [Candidatus Omnitrophota bacterium]
MDIREPELLHKVRDVLRLKKKETVHAFDGKGIEFSCKVISMDKKSLLLERREKSQEAAKPCCVITLAFPMLKEDKIDVILQKGTELGAGVLSPFISSRSIQATPSTTRLSRWHKIVIEATRQSERLWLPRVAPLCRIEEIITQQYDLKIVAAQKGKPLPENLRNKKAKQILLVSGPEGDFSPEEEKLIAANDFFPVSLSKNVLRAETASVALMGLVHYHTSFN